MNVLIGIKDESSVQVSERLLYWNNTRPRAALSMIRCSIGTTTGSNGHVNDSLLHWNKDESSGHVNDRLLNWNNDESSGHVNDRLGPLEQ
ncbi:hypothetical protein HNY73_008156 [Argiope bruennichi]|uniref:Uncharacterized protein n=1 Tax=Argiope bruennichi TaxID=94029 RepID=A0A8T0F6F2_ARGBR|nr:hypothetical protein HNY73_008156 [Argiope bruennichi]